MKTRQTRRLDESQLRTIVREIIAESKKSKMKPKDVEALYHDDIDGATRWAANQMAYKYPERHLEFLERFRPYIKDERHWLDYHAWLLEEEPEPPKKFHYLDLYNPRMMRKTEERLAWMAYHDGRHRYMDFFEPLKNAILDVDEWKTAHAGPKMSAKSKNKVPINKTACKRCGGSGKLSAYRHVDGGMCYRCHGRGY
jgi:hypothetical protein